MKFLPRRELPEVDVEPIEILDKYYAIIAANTIRSNSKYDVIASLHKSDEPCTFKISLKGPGLELVQTIELQPMSSKTLQFEIPKLEYGEYAIEAEGISGLIFSKSSTLNFNPKEFSVFIQTDKATYKPGDIVRYRVIAIDSNARPVKLNNNVDIVINDGGQNIIKKQSNATFTNSVHSGELELSEFPVLGDWAISVDVKGETLKSKNFEVAKYVLPKFEVTVDAPTDVALLDDKFTITVRGKYTYGKQLKGKATVTLKNVSYGYDEGLKIDCTKIANMDGSVDIDIDLEKDLKLTKYTDGNIPFLEVNVEVEEEHTALTRNASCQVNIHSSEYRIEGVDMPNEYHPGKPLTINCSVKKINGSPVTDTINRISLMATVSHGRFPGGGVSQKVLSFDSQLNEKGIASFNLLFPVGCKSAYTLRAKYLDEELQIGYLNKHLEPVDGDFMVKVDIKKPNLNEDIPIKVTSKNPLNYFLFKVLARGNIISSGFIRVPESETVHNFTIKPDFRMVPTATICISYIHEGKYVTEEVGLTFDNQFENKITIDAPQEAKPGDDVALRVKTSPDSFVGLMAVDQSVLLLKSGNDLNKEEIFSDFYDYKSVPYGVFNSSPNGVVTLTNAVFPSIDIMPICSMARSGGGVGMYAKQSAVMCMAEGVVNSPPVQIREKFPETWIWADINSKQDGIATLQTKVPDTLTSWILTGFSLSDKLGFALTDEASKLQVFQPFFVSTNLPYSVKRGEDIAVPALVFNYTDKTLEAVVTLDNSNNEFEFVDEPNVATQNVSIPPNETRVAYFRIRPTKIGQIALKIVATTPIAGDGINQMLRVEPEGVTEYVNKAVWVDLRVQQYQQDEIDIEIPDDIVAGSEYIEVSIIGDILGPTIKNLDKLVQMPCGCGEQNMINFVPNILVLQYLTSTGQLSEAIEAKAKKFMAVGYQRELTYKHEDGSYSAFGISDKSGSTWLTAYVARSFHQAVKYIEIDERILESALSFLAKTQTESGEFAEVGKLIDFKHSNGEGKGVALTAFVVLAFLENTELLSKFNGVVSKALTFLAENIPATGDLYALSIAAFALQSGKHDGAKKAVEKLKSLATQDGDRKWWSQPIAKSSKKHCWWQPRSVDVEITSYALMAIMQRDDAESALPIIKWLIAQRNSNGGFASTQDTVVGLQALIAFAEKTGCGKPAIEIGFADDLDNSTGLSINEENALVLHCHVLSKAARHVTIISEGAGSALAQVSYRYNIDKADKKPSFTVRPTVQPSARSDILLLDVRAAYNPTDSNKESNMAVMEVSLPSGFTADVDCFAKLEEIERVKRIDTKNDNSVVVIYFDSLAQDEVCCRVVATKSHEVSNQRPSAVVVFDYYDNNQRAKEFYELA